MPIDLYIVRHGASEQNEIVHAGMNGNFELFTQENVTVPDRDWRLTSDGRKQSVCIGKWLVEQQKLFDYYLVSPYIRARETAATMGLPKARWQEKRILRERSWGEISIATRDDFKKNYPRNYAFRQNDPIYWKPPAGESIADVSENRVHNLLTSLNKHNDGESVIMVTHGDFMRALMLTIEDLSDEEYMARSHDPEYDISNCTCMHYSRRDPNTGRTSKMLCWEQSATPIYNEDTGKWEVDVKPWREFHPSLLSNGDLVNIVSTVDRRLDNN